MSTLKMGMQEIGFEREFDGVVCVDAGPEVALVTLAGEGLVELGLDREKVVAYRAATTHHIASPITTL